MAACGQLVVKKGTVVPVRLLQQMSSATDVEGESVAMEVAADVVVDGRLVVRKGTALTAGVTGAHKKAGVGTGGRLTTRISSVSMADGEALPLATTTQDSGGGPGKKTFRTMAIASAILISPAGTAATLLWHGHEVVLPKGTEFLAEVGEDTTVERGKFAEATAAEASAATSALTPKRDAVLSMRVETNAGDGSLSAGGKFLGEVPTTVDLKRGIVTLTVDRKGYESWKEKVVVDGTGLVLMVEMKKK
jgi:hypothetical protein